MFNPVSGDWLLAHLSRVVLDDDALALLLLRLDKTLSSLSLHLLAHSCSK